MTNEEARDCLTRGGRKTTEDETKRFMEEYKAGTPVMPVSFFCDFLEEWADAYGEPLRREETHEGEADQRRRFVDGIRHVFLQIRKSNLLWRTIYRGERLRTEPCPEHRGRWSGCALPEETDCKGACSFGGNVTGWLPTKEGV
jgi:hypothetical protein